MVGSIYFARSSRKIQPFADRTLYPRRVPPCKWTGVGGATLFSVRLCTDRSRARHNRRYPRQFLLLLVGVLQPFENVVLFVWLRSRFHYSTPPNQPVGESIDAGHVAFAHHFLWEGSLVLLPLVHCAIEAVPVFRLHRAQHYRADPFRNRAVAQPDAERFGFSRMFRGSHRFSFSRSCWRANPRGACWPPFQSP